MDRATDQSDLAVGNAYEAPSLIELGSVVEVTHGAGEEDTADMKQWYN